MTIKQNRAAEKYPLSAPPMNIQQAADYLGVDVRWMRRAVFERRFPFYKVGRYLRFAREDLDQFLRAARVEPDR